MRRYLLSLCCRLYIALEIGTLTAGETVEERLTELLLPSLLLLLLLLLQPLLLLLQVPLEQLLTLTQCWLRPILLRLLTTCAAEAYPMPSHALCMFIDIPTKKCTRQAAGLTYLTLICFRDSW
jgi:hypothetical protein